jgi:hypothetical protein
VWSILANFLCSQWQQKTGLAYMGRPHHQQGVQWNDPQCVEKTKKMLINGCVCQPNFDYTQPLAMPGQKEEYCFRR